MNLTHGGLFEGYGGTTMAASMALGPLDTRWVSDIKPASVRLLAHHHPETPNLGDLTTIDWAAVEPVDVLTFSWPCQPFSSAGRRLGEEDPRALLPHVVHAISVLRPRILLGENVARIVGSGELRRAVRALAELGYVGAWRCLRASDVGAPHKRDRCFLAAIDAAAHPGTAGWTEGLGVGRPAGPTAVRDDHEARAERLRLLPTPTADHGDRRRGSPSPEVGQRRMDAGRRMLEDVVAARLTKLLPTPCVGDSRNTRNATARRSDGQEHHHAGETLCDVVHPAWTGDWREYEPSIRRWESVLGRPAPAPTQPSLRAPHGPQLAPRFVEWMMGLPEGWVTDVPDLAPRGSGHRNAALSLLGDGVVPQQGGAAYTELLAHLLDQAAA